MNRRQSSSILLAIFFGLFWRRSHTISTEFHLITLVADQGISIGALQNVGILAEDWKRLLLAIGIVETEFVLIKLFEGDDVFRRGVSLVVRLVAQP